jgi:hypothetical protein
MDEVIGDYLDRLCTAGDDHLVVAAISDWGAYGVAASLACSPELAVRAGPIDRALRSCADAGAVGGVAARPVLRDDGILLETRRSFVTLLQAIVTIGLSYVQSPGH